MTTREALQELGVKDDTLTEDEKRSLDSDGYLFLPDIFTAAQADALNSRLAQLLATEGEAAGTEVHQEAGTDRLSNLVHKGAVFQLCFTHPRVLAAVSHVLSGDLKLSSLNARAALPGQGLQGLHADWGKAVAADAYEVCNSIWLLDDFTERNGATRVVPGSHRSGKMPQEAMADSAKTHSDERMIVAPVGTVVVFNSHVWHGGTLNRSDVPRRALHSYFTRRHNPQQLDQRKYLTRETQDQLSHAIAWILDVEK